MTHYEYMELEQHWQMTIFNVQSIQEKVVQGELSSN